MTTDDIEPDGLEPDRAKLIGETARIAFSDLQRFFAAGRVVHVDDTLDLIDVATQFTRDLIDDVRELALDDRIRRLQDDTARAWLDEDAEVWAVVVSPWVLVQRNRRTH